MKKISEIGIAAGTIIALAAACGVAYLAVYSVEDQSTGWILPCLILSLFVYGLGVYLYYRRRFVRFSDTVCEYTDQILAGQRHPQVHNYETLTSKMQTSLEKVTDILETRTQQSEQEKEQVQSTISDVVHQLKIPLANVRMYGDMLSEECSAKERERFSDILHQQTEKLEFLMDVLVKMSRLENQMIKMNLEESSLFETLALAINSIASRAEQRGIRLSVACDRDVCAMHDRKWTVEAFENILDNAVKYSKADGKINISVIPGEMFIQVKIEDNGIGIKSEHVNDIFKRFYRENRVPDREGLGIGLYLARQIISLQKGYIKVESQEDKGSVFSIFLPVYLPE